MNRILGNLGKTDINEKKIKITLMGGIQKKSMYGWPKYFSYMHYTRAVVELTKHTSTTFL